MSLPALLRQTAARYQAAVQRVLAGWNPECGCDRPGAYPHCEACPCLGLFEQKIHAELLQATQTHPAKELPHERIYLP